VHSHNHHGYEEHRAHDKPIMIYLIYTSWRRVKRKRGIRCTRLQPTTVFNKTEGAFFVLQQDPTLEKFAVVLSAMALAMVTVIEALTVAPESAETTGALFVTELGNVFNRKRQSLRLTPE